LKAPTTHPIENIPFAIERLAASDAQVGFALFGCPVDTVRVLLVVDFQIGLGAFGEIASDDAQDAAIARIDKQVDGNVEPFRVAGEMLDGIPGVNSLSAEVIIAEIGVDMSC
jgi:hypothetical protein